MGDQGPGRGQGVVAAGADAEDAVGRLDDVAGAGDEQRVLGVDDGDQRFEPAQGAVDPPVLGQLGRGAGTLAGWSFSFASNRSIRAKASAAAPAKPTSTWPSMSLRILMASLLTTVCPSVTWPSPPMATRPLCGR